MPKNAVTRGRALLVTTGFSMLTCGKMVDFGLDDDQSFLLRIMVTFRMMTMTKLFTMIMTMTKMITPS